MSRSTHISRLVAVAVAAVAFGAPPALADPPQLRRDDNQLQNWRLLEQIEMRGVAQPRGVVGPSVGYETSVAREPRLRSVATAAPSSDGIAWRDATIGGAIGFALALVLLVSAQTGRGRMRTAHS